MGEGTDQPNCKISQMVELPANHLLVGVCFQSDPAAFESPLLLLLLLLLIQAAVSGPNKKLIGSLS